MIDSRSISSSAPGKVILCGEYAVLDAWPALVVAVNRRLNMSLIPSEGAGVLIKPAGLTQKECALEWGDRSQLIVEANSPLKMFSDIFNLLITAYEAQTHFCGRGWFINSDSSALFDGKQKLGLGSSAALTVALAGLIHKSMGRALPNKGDLWKVLQLVHSKAQSKRGSGVDLAASIAGGVHRFVNQNDTHADLDAVSLPAGIHFRFIWTGKSASTPKFLASLSEWKENNATFFEHHMHALGSASSTVCTTQNSDLFLVNMALFIEALRAFNHEASLGIFSGAHEYLYQEAKRYEGLLYKPCGAGGGDLGVALSDDVGKLDAFEKAVSRTDIRAVQLQIEAEGLNVAIE